MQSMWNLLENALSENRDLFPDHEVNSEIIDGASEHNKKTCVLLINEILGVDTADINNTDGVTQDRAVHSMITFLLGMEIGKFRHLIDLIHKTGLEDYGITAPRLWMMTALAHDYGYSSRDIYKQDYDLSLALRDGNLLTDSYEEPFYCLNDYSLHYPMYITYNYETIQNYFRYKQEVYAPGVKKAHPDWAVEFSDHGIIGGCKLFQKYIRKCRRNIQNNSSSKNSDDLHLLYKTACILAAQHNIFRSYSKKTDQLYSKYNLNQLLSTSPVAVTEKNPLLLLLSLVDTIECTKRFSQSSNPRKYFLSRTVLENILIEVNENEIILDYSPLQEKAATRDGDSSAEWNSFTSRLASARNGVSTFDTWTAVKAEPVDGNEYVLRITAQE